MRKLIFVGAHPDDIELDCGGTIAYFANKGYNIECIFLTNGQAGGDPVQRQEESINACISLGVRDNSMIKFGTFEDRRVLETFDVIDYLENLYYTEVDGRKKADPDVHAVFIHSPDDVHQDHRAVAECCRTAFRHAPRIFAYEAPSATASFNPTSFVNISGFVISKWNALTCHRSQIELGRAYIEYKAMLRLASFRGSQFGVPFAEAFQTLKNQIDVCLAKR